MLNFYILEKGLGIVSPPHCVYDFSTKIFSINWPNVIVWLPLPLELLDNICIAVVYFPGCDVLNFKFKGKLSGLGQFLATESSLKMMKIAFYLTSKALFVLKIFKFLSWFFGHVLKELD